MIPVPHSAHKDLTAERVMPQLQEAHFQDVVCGTGALACDNAVKPFRTAGGGCATPLAAGVLCAMAVVAALSLYVSWQRQVRPASAVLAGIPKSLGDWAGTDQLLDAHVYEILGTRDVLSRSYVNSKGDQVTLLIVLAQQTRSRTHPPEQCLTGEGYTILGARDRDLNIGSQAIPIREIQLSRSQGQRLSWHFYKSGNHLSTSYWGHQIGIALRKLKDPLAADALIRAETDADPNNPDRGQHVLTDFFAAVTPSVLSKLP